MGIKITVQKCKKNLNPWIRIQIFCCPDRIRTHTNRTRICGATITQQGKCKCAAKIHFFSYRAFFFEKKSFNLQKPLRTKYIR